MFAKIEMEIFFKKEVKNNKELKAKLKHWFRTE